MRNRLGLGIAVAGLIAATLVVRLPAAAPPPVTRTDLRWLSRVTFGLDSATLARFRQLGRAKYLDEQLHPPSGDAPDVAAMIAPLSIAQTPSAERLRTMVATQRTFQTMAPEDRQKAQMALNQAGNQAIYDTTRRDLMRAMKSPAQLREVMTWFWMNHFTVFSGKANVRWTLADYEDVVRDHALGKFSDLVMATLTSPAMLEYLDNAQSAAGHINENYARELMELHTLGVSGGPSGSTYTQQDVQELARVLTGAGINLSGEARRVPPQWERYYVHRGAFEFNPMRHDFGTKTVLGRRVDPGGLDEIDHVVTWLCQQPATARFISRKLATFFVADAPPAALVDRIARVFEKTDGSIADVLAALLTDRDFLAGLDAPKPPYVKFKDPMAFVVSSLRLAYDGKAFTNYRPVVGWLQQLGEPLYGRVTPDGYPLTEDAWASSGQLVKRFEIARMIGSGNAGLFNTDDGKPGETTGFPVLNSRLYYDAIEPALGTRTTGALARASSQQEWNTLLLSSPDWMQR